MPAKPLPLRCVGPLNAAPWLRRLLSWRYVCGQPSTCCGRNTHGCPIRALRDFNDGNGVIGIQVSKHCIANDFRSAIECNKPIGLGEPDGAVLKSYKETNRFLADAGVPESYGRGGADGADSFSDEDEDEPVTQAIPVPAPVPAPKISASAGAPEDGPLTVNFDAKSISLRGKTTSPSDFREFIDVLTAMADLFEKLAPPIKGLPLPKEESDAEDE